MTATAPPTEKVLLHVDPRTLILGPNVRTLRDNLDADFVESIRERGVLQPITAYEGKDGHYVVEHGARRTLAAIAADLPTVPVYVVPAPDDADRIVDQVTENHHRLAITTGDRVKAFEQLAAVGLSAAQIAKKLATKRGDVDTALTIAKSKQAVDAVDEYSAMTLEQAAAIAEFDDDNKAVDELLASLDPNTENEPFPYVLEGLRQQRAENEAYGALEAELKAAGVLVVPDAPSWDSNGAWLDRLKSGSKNCSAANHANCPGHAAWLQRRYDHAKRDAFGNPTMTYEAKYLCTDWKKNGHTDKYASSSSSSSTSSGSTSGGMSDADKAERKRVIAGGKAWRTATAVRRAWLAQFIQRKDAPDDVERFIAAAVGHCDHVIRRAFEQSHSFYTALGHGDADKVDYVEKANRRQLLIDEIATAAKGRALVITAGLILAAWEADAADAWTWRQTDREHGRYLAAMKAWGYEPSSIEQALIDGTTWQPPTS